ncbi:MAG: GH116 family glycosyl-hydrolase, partial [Mariniphaga sp.]
MKKLTTLIFAIIFFYSCTNYENRILEDKKDKDFNGHYTGEFLNRVAFPIGGLGSGMFCIEGNGSFSHFSVRNAPNMFARPLMFGAISVKGIENGAKIIEGPVQDWKIFGSPGTGSGNAPFGVPRFEKSIFVSRFPFAELNFKDTDIPFSVNLTSWSPFIPLDADNSGLPAGALEYTFSNPTPDNYDAVFSFHSENFMSIQKTGTWTVSIGDSIKEVNNGFILSQSKLPGKPHCQGDFAITTDDTSAIFDYSWFRGGWFDGRTVLWNDVMACNTPSRPVAKGAEGASIYVPFSLKSFETKSIKIMLSWYVPLSEINISSFPYPDENDTYAGTYEPWYSGRFKNIQEVADYWKANYNILKTKTELFTNTLYSSEIPPEVLDAVAANLSILKSPTILRQKDGRLWGWEGCDDFQGSCPGSCTHVWNYAQSISRLFPDLERSLRETEFFYNQNEQGHQTFRAYLPIRPTAHEWHAAADGQLGGIMKAYREWRISGDNEWIENLWPQIKRSMDYCIEQWDPRHTGTLEEPHHNTYDIEFWGPNGMSTSFYLGALSSVIKIAELIDEDTGFYKELFSKGKKAIENELFNGEYFYQKVVWEGLNTSSPIENKSSDWNISYSPEALEIFKKEGPKYQYGTGCLSDGELGFWIARMCGLGDIIDLKKE